MYVEEALVGWRSVRERNNEVGVLLADGSEWLLLLSKSTNTLTTLHN